MTRSLAISALSLAVTAATTTSKQEPTLWVAVVSSDGRAVPIGRLQEDKWSSPWPEPRDDAPKGPTQLAWKDIPLSWLGGARISASWPVWWRDGGPQALTFAEAAQVERGCVLGWELKSNIHPRPSNSDSGWDGLALVPSSDVSSVNFFQKAVYDEDGVCKSGCAGPDLERKILVAIQPRFEELEMEKLGRFVQDRVGKGTSVSPFLQLFDVERRRWPIELYGLERSNVKVGGAELLHVSVLRTDAYASNGPHCHNERSDLSAWLALDAAGALTVLDASLEWGETCIGEPGGLTTTEAVAAVVYRAHTLLVTYDVGYEADWYTILELKDGRPVEQVVASLGGC